MSSTVTVHLVCSVRLTIKWQLDQAITARVKDGPKDLDIVGWMGRTALELVGQGGLGYSFDPLVEDTKDEFADSVKAFVYVLPSPQSRFWC